MTGFVIYSLKAAILTAAFYTTWRLLLSKETLHRLNRIVMVLIPVISMILPLCVITIHKKEMVEGVATLFLEGQPASTAQISGHVTGTLLTAIYLMGIILVLARVTWSVWKIMRLIRSGVQAPSDDNSYSLVVTGNDVAPFSWMKYIVISREDFESGNPEIIIREKAHIKLRHSLDILIIDILTAFQWYNPMIWMLGTDLRAIHEYEADEETIKQGIDATQYQLFLIRKAAADRGYTLANSLHSGTIKNRITMMLKKKTKSVSGWKLLLMLPIIGMSLAATAKTVIDYQDPQEPEKTKAEPFQMVNVKPTFDGMDAQEFSKWVNSNLVYPAEAFKKGISGRVTLCFTITENGKVTDVKVLRGADPLLDAEAVRVVSSSPDWTPGKNKEGKIVPVVYTFPVIFTLR